MSWYKDGLRFKCTGCGDCCTGAPGHVWVTEKEIVGMAETFKITPEAFSKKYTRLVGSRLSLIEDPHTYDCVFLEDKKCQLYNARPKQCSTFPWWDENLSSPGAWENTAKSCEGIDHPDAALISFETIETERTRKQ